MLHAFGGLLLHTVKSPLIFAAPFLFFIAHFSTTYDNGGVCICPTTYENGGECICAPFCDNVATCATVKHRGRLLDTAVDRYLGLSPNNDASVIRPGIVWIFAPTSSQLYIYYTNLVTAPTSHQHFNAASRRQNGRHACSMCVTYGASNR